MIRVKRIYETVKYMTFRQWKYRIYYTARNKIVPRRKTSKDKSVGFVRRLKLNYSNYNCIDDLKEANDILKNKIHTISGRVEKFDSQVDWDMKAEKYRLVCFRVNSFRYLMTLSDAYKTTGNNEYIKKGFELIDDWILKNIGFIDGDKWNAYVIADRLMNWIGFISEYGKRNELHKYAQYIYVQAIELKKNLEFQLGANHLLSEAKALVSAGSFLNDIKLYKYGKKILIEEFETQFLSDGGHYERSISYHVESLQQYFETIFIMNEMNDIDVYKIMEMVKKPYQFLNNMISVNGQIPLFNDASIDYPFYDARDFLSTANYLYESSPPNGKEGLYYKKWKFGMDKRLGIEWQTIPYMDSTGFVHYCFKVYGISYSLFFDVGDNGPDSNLGHAHADALNVLWSSEYKNIFIDSGVFTYKKSYARDECRSTKAHNTIEIDNKNSADVWDAFRVAKRGHTKVNSYEINKDGIVIKASHNGYETILHDSLIHEREIRVFPKVGRIIISDELKCKKNHNAVLRYHINPECMIDKINSNECKIDNDILIKISNPINFVKCNIAEKFGIMKEALCLESAFDTNETKKIITTIQIKEKMKHD